MAAYSFPLAFPSAAVFSVDYAPRSVSAVGRSPFTGRPDQQSYTGHWWVWTVSLTAQQDPDLVAELETFFLELNGMEGTFLLGDPAKAAPRGGFNASLDTPVVDSAGSPSMNLEGDRVLLTDGWRTNQTGILKRGDMFQLGSAGTATLHTCLRDVDTDSLGAAEIDIWPRLRRTPNDNAALTVTGAKGQWKLVEDPTWTAMPGGIYDGFTFTIQEWWI